MTAHERTHSMRDHTMLGGVMVDEDGNNISGGYVDNEYSEGMIATVGADVNFSGASDGFQIIKDPS